MLKVHEDNRDPNYPLAYEMVPLLCGLFDRPREALEDLNANDPY